MQITPVWFTEKVTRYMTAPQKVEASADDLFYPPRPSRGTRGPFRPNRGSSRARIVGGTVPTEMRMESGLEKKAAYVLLADPEVVDIREQPPAIDYVEADGTPVSYTWDAIVSLRSGTRILVAIKPETIALKTGLRERIARFAAQTPRSVADKAVLITGEKLPRDLVHDAMLIQSVRRDPDRSADVTVRTFVAGLAGTVTVATIVAATGLGALGFRATVRLVADGTLAVVGGGRIGYGTRVALSNSRSWRAA